MCFLYTDSFLFRIYDEDSIWQLLHIFNSAKVLLQLIPFFFQLDNFFFRKYIECSVFSHSLDVFQTFDTALDCLEVCEHSSKPSLIYIIHSATLSLSLDCILCLLLCSYEKDRSAICCNIRYCLVCIVYHSYRLLQVDDIDTISFCVDIRSHLRIPSSCLMSKMNTGFQ